MKKYLIQVIIPLRSGFKKEIIIEEGEIKDIIKKFQGDVKLRFFKIDEVFASEGINEKGEKK